MRRTPRASEDSIRMEREASTSQQRPNLIFSGHRKYSTLYQACSSGNADSHADSIVAKLEENSALLDDTPISEQLRKEALKDLPECLTIKRSVKTKLCKSVSQKSERRPIGFWKRCKHRINITWRQFVTSFKNFNYFELWHDGLKKVEGHFGSGYASYFKFLRWLFVLNFIFTIFSITLLVVPQAIYDSNNTDFKVEDLFTGKGNLSNSVVYYGHYTNDTITKVLHISFDMPWAYFSVTIILYLVFFIIVAISVAESYRRTFIETEGSINSAYANRVFCGWDFSIATKEAAKLKSSSIFNELKELLSEEMNYLDERTFLVKFWTFFIQLIVNMLVIVSLFGIGWLNWFLLKTYEEDSPWFTAITMNIIIMLLPTVFSYIAQYEEYRNPRTAMYVTLIRTYLLGAVIIAITLTFWLTHNKDYWENQLGAEIYRLTLFDFFFNTILSTIIDITTFLTLKFLRKNPKTEFNVAKNTLQLIYNQGLLWVGFYYSPILPAIVTIKMFIIWYLRYLCVTNICVPPKKTWRAAQAHTWFMMMTFISILFIIAAHFYSLNSVRPTCGPFRHYNYTYEILTNHTQGFEATTFGGVVMNVTKPGGVAFIMIALLILVYYLKEQALSNRERVSMLRETLIWMAKDKKYLLDWYNNEITKQDINSRRIRNDSGCLDDSDYELRTRFSKHN